MTKREVARLSEDATRRAYPITGTVPGWYFRAVEASAGVWRVEGTDLWGRRVERTGTDLDELFARCREDAAAVAQEAAASTEANQ